ncbi:MAG: asparagine synthase (glutamine-hydrolyzing) [Ignavibacteria bacterium]|nr:asparagine synthase (glutamine-hydrolyzing) [Ignavibacteria bacterium]
MCGIVGIRHFNKTLNESYDSALLLKMTNLLRHRGPDSNGIWFSPSKQCAFGFRRLAIIDLSEAGNQPMQTDDGNVTIVFNGEIYNYLTLRKELIEKGYKFRSRTDTEVILNGYKEWGLDVVKRISGMFAFVIWDEHNQLLFGARDRVGKKPLYYFYDDEIFIFASEIKSILIHPRVQKNVNFKEIPNYLNFGISSNRNTLFENINKIPPAHFFTLDVNRDFKLRRYWNPFALGKNEKISENEAVEEILRLLRQAVKDRMMSDVPFGVFLSGGIDSSLNVALMSELMTRPVDTFTVGFKELEKYNELYYARTIVNLFKTNQHEILIDSDDAFEVLEELVWFEDEPNADPVCIPLFFLSKLTRESGTIVVQVGEGSDEQFVGYPWLLRDFKFYHNIWKPFDSLPTPIKRSLFYLSKPIFSKIKQYLPLDFIRRSAYNEEYYWSGTPIFPPSELEVILNHQPKYFSHIPWQYVNNLLSEAKNLNSSLDFLQWVLFVEISQRLSELLLMRVDKMGMAHSIEARVPFLDYRLIEFTMSLPQKLKVPNGRTTKYLLKKAAERILPKEIVYRKKQGFWAPISEWLRNEWFDFACERISNSNLLRKISNLEYINIMLQEHRKSKKNYGFKIFTLLNLALWYDRFFSNERLY